MTHHVTEDELILHFYGEAPADERRVDEHLRVCPDCQAAWAELTDTLKLVDAAAPPEPPDGFERVVWARLAPALAPPGRRWSVRALAPFAAVAALLLVAAALAFAWIARRPAVPAVAQIADAPRTVPAATVNAQLSRKARERVLLAALDDHFAQTEVLLVELLNAPDAAPADIDFERTSADDLLASGRLYRETARQSGDLQLAQMLDDLESVLVEVARSPAKPDRRDFNSLRTRIASNSLLFKVRAVANQIHERQQDLMTD